MKRRKSRTSNGKKRACPCLAIQTPLFVSQGTVHRPSLTRVGSSGPRRIYGGGWLIPLTSLASLSRGRLSRTNLESPFSHASSIACATQHTYTHTLLSMSARLAGVMVIPAPPPGSAWLQLPGTITGDLTLGIKPRVQSAK